MLRGASDRDRTRTNQRNVEIAVRMYIRRTDLVCVLDHVGKVDVLERQFRKQLRDSPVVVVLDAEIL